VDTDQGDAGAAAGLRTARRDCSPGSKLKPSSAAARASSRRPSLLAAPLVRARPEVSDTPDTLPALLGRRLRLRSVALPPLT
jgi:hypothetical protein